MKRMLFAFTLIFASLGVAEVSANQVVQVTKDNFREEVTLSSLPVVVDLYSEFCPHCRRLDSVFSELSNEMGHQVKFVKINTYLQKDLSKRLGVSAIPTLLFFKGGKVVGRHTGSLAKNQLRNQVVNFLL